MTLNKQLNSFYKQQVNHYKQTTVFKIHNEQLRKKLELFDAKQFLENYPSLVKEHSEDKDILDSIRAGLWCLKNVQ